MMSLLSLPVSRSSAFLFAGSAGSAIDIPVSPFAFRIVLGVDFADDRAIVHFFRLLTAARAGVVGVVGASVPHSATRRFIRVIAGALPGLLTILGRDPIGHDKSFPFADAKAWASSAVPGERASANFDQVTGASPHLTD
ncbi:hypothetical protein A8V01_24490 [Novosphingobium guangzhouense]|uniref:Uncharacterized protein n=1 Tax=Novosphingobium guangzhouense TaxID=1850347 RepID=A0A2K2FWS3_9SPHN|nr:hypothetical protein A8V01_24490 [Novosphingobium guangzhouense]